ncbi:class I SAM-dependent methyltransferase [Xanthovirga aplysinae]|uniref:class I SAM-dependent methyltransferase n=1 Tax=Xanthovirga aplysinae TaxID=2529853 RepID=UPI0012BC4EF2|nr:class I SAM-dependent methyltransferase [Xanthovirga aplysinae]MTI33137.1 class I SAM-dependent methyltransferase [Xanthovirga aplysinae]
MKTYHDFVIKDGQFIGEFEEMYQNCEDPWEQSTQPNKYSRAAGILHIKNFGIKSILECGCGLGYYADWIYKETGIIPKSLDISPNAIKRAKRIFPHLDFELADITRDLKKYNNINCVLFAEILWYILPQLDDLFEVLLTEFPQKYFLVNQVFYKGSQKYGTEYFTTIQEFIDYVPFPLLGKCEATTIQDTTIETSTIFKIQLK